MKHVRKSAFSWLVALGLAATLARCTSSPPAPTTVCAPGTSTTCTGPGGCAGGQTCNSNGTAFESCLCLVTGGSGTGTGTGSGTGSAHRDGGRDARAIDSGDGGEASDSSTADGATDAEFGLGMYSCLEQGVCLLFRTLAEAEASCCTSDASCCSDAGCSPHGTLGSACPTTGYEQGFLGTCTGGTSAGQVWSYYSATTDADMAEDACVESMGIWSNSQGMGTCSKEASQVSMACTNSIFYCTGSDTPATDGVAEMCTPLALEINLPRDMSDGLTAYCCQ
jgi:hypothetical protein